MVSSYAPKSAFGPVELEVLDQAVDVPSENYIRA